jgi:large subunit ribosomal protein L1
MAKKQKTEAAAPEETSAAPPAAEGKPAAKEKGKEPKKPREPKEPKAKTAPSAPAPAAPGPAVAPPAASPAAPPAGAPPAAAGEPTKKKGKRPGTGPRRGKKLRERLRKQRQELAKDGPVAVKKAVVWLKQKKRSKFDETVEVHMALGVDMTQSDQIVRGTVSLPHGIGKSVRVLVFCQGDNVAKAKDAGANYAGSDELIKKIQQEGWLDFDIALATQDMMGQVSRLGKILGPRGLMPTPKAGTVLTGDVTNSIREFKAGKVEYRTDKGGNVHAGVGKLSFDEQKLVDNVTAFVEQVRASKPAGVKGNYVKSITLSATMSPGIPLAM